MADTNQSYKTHAKFVPLYHYVLFPVMVVNLGIASYQLWRQPAFATTWAVVMALALTVLTFFARIFALQAQDRVIRLEERLRLRELLPVELKPRVNEFSREQLIALRFASDGELPDLAAAVLRDGVQKRDHVKKMVRQWRADDHQL